MQVLPWLLQAADTGVVASLPPHVLETLNAALFRLSASPTMHGANAARLFHWIKTHLPQQQQQEQQQQQQQQQQVPQQQQQPAYMPNMPNMQMQMPLRREREVGFMPQYVPQAQPMPFDAYGQNRRQAGVWY